MRGEPLPPFDTRYKNVLESILGSVKLKAKLYNFNIPEVAANYYVELAKSQAFMNGNKRMSIILTDAFLLLNGYQLKTAWIDWADLTLFISKMDECRLSEIVQPLFQIFEKFIKKTS